MIQSILILILSLILIPSILQTSNKSNNSFLLSARVLYCPALHNPPNHEYPPHPEKNAMKRHASQNRPIPSIPRRSGV